MTKTESKNKKATTAWRGAGTPADPFRKIEVYVPTKNDESEWMWTRLHQEGAR